MIFLLGIAVIMVLGMFESFARPSPTQLERLCR
jgi:hypothetical protein